MALSQGETVKGKKEGLWITYYANGVKRSEGAFCNGVKHGPWTLYHPNGNKQSEATFHNGLYTDWYTTYYENGHKKWEGPYAPITGKASDGRKEGVWNCYSERDGTTIWRIITYKTGARAKPDEHPLGPCSQCGNPIHDPGTGRCPECGG